MAGGTDTSTSRPYNFFVAIVALLVALIASYIVLKFSFDAKLVKSSTDLATVMGALGGLFTLIGTVAGAYFGIKLSGDQAKRTENANKDALDAAITVDPKTAEAEKLQRRVRGLE